MDKVKQIVTGGAYDKPALTKDGAVTTQDADNAHTIKGTSADPNYTPPTGAFDKAEQLADKASSAGYKAEEKVKQGADQVPEEHKQKLPDSARDKANV